MTNTITLPTPEAKAKLMQLAYDNGLMQKPVLKVRLDCTEDKVLRYSVIEQSEDLRSPRSFCSLKLYKTDKSWCVESNVHPQICDDIKVIFLGGYVTDDDKKIYDYTFTTNTIRDSTAHEIKQALEEFGTAKNVDVTVDLIQPELNEHGFNVLKDGDTYYLHYMGSVLSITWDTDSVDYSRACSGLVFLTRPACTKAVANGLFDKIKLKAEIYACYHKWLPKDYVYRVGDKFRAPFEFDSSSAFAEFKFPNTNEGMSACDSFVAEIGADKLRAYVEGGV